MTRVIGTCDATDFPSILEFDEYVPISFRTYVGLLGGARYVQLGNLHTSLLELRVPRDSMVVRSFSLTLFDRLSSSELHGNCGFDDGLPILELPEQTAFSGPEAAYRADIHTEFSLYIDSQIAEIKIGDAVEFDRGLKHERVALLISQDRPVGIRMNDLTADEIGRLSLHLDKLRSSNLF